MPPRKHQRAASDPSSNAGPSAKASKTVKVERSNALPRASFQDLPFELRKTILDLACSRSLGKDDKDASFNAARRISLDSNTLFNLILVSRDFYATLKPTLWRHVKLVRPSQLAEFREALVSHTANGELVRSLHIGPLSDLPRGWWPVRPREREEDDYEEEALVLLRTSLGKWEGAMRPLWCKPGKEWAYSLAPRSCQGRAVADAIRSALAGVDIEFGDPDYEDYEFCDFNGNYIGIGQWTLRLFELQGSLDLYLGEMRRIEDAEGRPVQSWKASKSHPVGKDPRDCRHGKCGHYPQLLLRGFAGCKKRSVKGGQGSTRTSQIKKEKSSDDIFVVNRDDVMRHVWRAGAPTDHFDHPLLFVRSGARLLALSHDGAVRVNAEQKQQEDIYSEIDSGDDMDEQSGTGRRYGDNDFPPSGLEPLMSPSSKDSVGSADDTFDFTHYEGLSALAESVLRRTPKVINLSLTGFVHRCLQRKPPLLAKLRCLSVGPPALSPGAGLAINLPLPSMEKLRFCGDFIGVCGARRVSGLLGDWKNLRELQWDFAGSRSGWGNDAAFVTSMIHLMQGRENGLATIQNVNGFDSDESSEDEDEDLWIDGTFADPEVRYIEARIRPILAASVLGRAFSPELRQAWQYGWPVADAPHRICIMESRAANIVRANDRVTPRQDFDVYRAESEQWWEECAWEIEHESGVIDE